MRSTVDEGRGRRGNRKSKPFYSPSIFKPRRFAVLFSAPLHSPFRRGHFLSLFFEARNLRSDANVNHAPRCLARRRPAGEYNHVLISGCAADDGRGGVERETLGKCGFGASQQAR